MSIDKQLLRKIIEGSLLAAGTPLSVQRIQALFDPPEGSELELEAVEKPAKDEIQAALEDIQADCQGRGYELKEVGTGWRFQVVEETAPWIARLFEEKPQKYSRALLETLALIAYRQPITRGDIEAIRGVAVSSNIIRTLTEREWVKVVGHRDVPGRPALYATTRQFLDYFNIKNLDELPSLREIQDFEKLDSELDLQAAQQSNSGDKTQAAAENFAQPPAADSDVDSTAEPDATATEDTAADPTKAAPHATALDAEAASEEDAVEAPDADEDETENTKPESTAAKPSNVVRLETSGHSD